MSDVFLLMLRRLRAPMLVLIVVYGVAVGGLAMMPGQLPDGTPARLSIFHAFYIMSYTATTIGFGEVPHPFTDAQRLWVIVSIYLSVIAWAYAVGSVFALINDATFRSAVARSVFTWRVRGIGEPFFIICGAGQSGTALAKALDKIGYRLVVVEILPERSARIELEEFVQPPMVLTGDARLPDVLEDAGIHRPECEGLISLVRDDSANQAISIGARTLNQSMRVIARAKSNVAQVNLSSFGGVHVINPFETFATNVSLDLASPEVLRLEEWLTDAPGTECPDRVNIPTGPWVLVGYGRFGHAISAVLDRAGISWRAIDVNPLHEEDERLLTAANSESAIREAGIERAAVLVAGTDSDASNLGVVTLARRANPGLFVIIRQNHVADRVLIATADANLQFVQSALMVHECLQIIKTPMLGRFISHVRAQGGALAAEAIARIQAEVGSGAPRAWTFVCDIMQPGMFGAFFQGQGERLTIDHLTRYPGDADSRLQAVPLMLDRRGEHTLMPPADMALKPGDQLLFVGSDEAMRVQQRFLSEPGAIQYVRSGTQPPRGWVFRQIRSLLSRS
ncbi:MAG: NAD-binding protein [Burkholderiaceae bacterium]